MAQEQIESLVVGYEDHASAGANAAAAAIKRVGDEAVVTEERVRRVSKSGEQLARQYGDVERLTAKVAAITQKYRLELEDLEASERDVAEKARLRTNILAQQDIAIQKATTSHEKWMAGIRAAEAASTAQAAGAAAATATAKSWAGAMAQVYETATTVSTGVNGTARALQALNADMRSGHATFAEWAAGAKALESALRGISAAQKAINDNTGVSRSPVNVSTIGDLRYATTGTIGAGLVYTRLVYTVTPLTPTQLAKIEAADRLLFDVGASMLLGGTSNAVSSLDRDPLTGRLVCGTGDGVSVFKGLRRVSYFDEVVLAATTSDTVRGVALRGGSLLIGTAAEVGVVQDAIGGKEAILAGGPRPVGAGFNARGVTTDATPLDLAPRVPIGERETVMVEARVIGRVVGAADTERLTYVRRATYYRDAGGGITLQGSVQTSGTDTEVTGTADATLAIVGDWVAARVTGVSGKRIRWESTFTVTRLSEETSYAA